MALDFLTPLNDDILDFVNDLSSQHLGSKVVFHTKNDFPDIKKIKIAIVGVLENRGDASANFEVNLDFIRKELYSLYPGNWNATIADFGDLLPGDSKEDTYFALQKIGSFLIKNGIVPIIIGGSQDLTYPLYRAYDNLDQMVNLVSVDSKFDFGRENQEISVKSYLSQIIAEEPNNLFNFSNIGFQTYYNSQEEIDLIDKLYFEAIRLGQVSNDSSIVEPIFRDADLISLDLNSVMSSYSANFVNFEPNGFSGKEICAISRYAGISDKVSCLGIFNHKNSIQESVLVAQIIWYFIEGFHLRTNDYPYTVKDNYIKYIVTLDEDLIFYKSNISERWWIEIAFSHNNSNKKEFKSLFPCDYKDYLMACEGEIPERWWKAQRKILT